MGCFPAQLLLLALTGPCLAREELELVPAVQGSPFSTSCYYNNDKYSPKEKFWCKMLSDQECNSKIFLSIQAKGEKYLNIAPKRRVHLTNSGTGWISVSMTELRIEDSGTYLCGIFDHQTIIPLKMIKVAVSYDAPMRLSAKKGGSISLNCSYFVNDNSRRPNNFTWCKMITATRCQPVVSVKMDQIVNTQGRTRIKIDRWNRVIIVTLVALQLRDSGKYHCETHLQGSTVLLKMITLNVLEPYDRTAFLTTSCPTDNIGAILPTASRNDQQSWYSEVNLSVVGIMTGLLGAKFLTALLIFIVASKRRSKATEQENHGQPEQTLVPPTHRTKARKGKH
ncbi:trem-like transcript 1 protein isoform X7 [Gopherus flavomarginatus]|uniref:trem-like transcript 1 protein isoform X7 n=1 Tax=Gopherus flavomarginatus TaxID=286002 RepID=UPI0021CC4894|nr:trem-like transcript 1 protein isoform X7 [Gopherus flavomarginatus]